LIGELRVTDGADAGKMFAIRDDTVLGRDDSADVVLKDESGELSRRHARIGMSDGVVMLDDLDSTNGTFLNGERIDGPRPLRSGDRFRVGSSTLEFVSAPEPQLTRAREVLSEAQLTRAREVLSDAQLTRARDSLGEAQLTRARGVAPEPQLTAAHAVAQDPQRTHTYDIGPDPQLTRARDVPELVPPPPSAPPTPRAPTYAPPGADGDLQILSGPGAGAEAAVIGGSATIGREPECDLQVLDSEVSRRHAKVTVRDGEAAIEDLNSANGTYVNGERILGPYKLAPGDHIEIGEATIQLTSPVFEHAAARTLPPQPSAVRDVLTQSSRLLRAESGNRKWWTLAVVLITVFMLLLDVTIVAVALPTISAALHPSFSQLQWIVDAYALMLTAALLTMGSMADIYGRKRVLTAGLILFTIASVLCAQAPNATVLDLSRGLQGIGGATMFACSLALIVQEFPAGERALAFGAYGAVSGLSVALGPVIGGLLVDGIGWQAIFYINVPVAVIAFVIL
jgi:pSer/pThr/pTyr-binding forkhead associated (FHA) protein